MKNSFALTADLGHPTCIASDKTRSKDRFCAGRCLIATRDICKLLTDAFRWITLGETQGRDRTGRAVVVAQRSLFPKTGYAARKWLILSFGAHFSRLSPFAE